MKYNIEFGENLLSRYHHLDDIVIERKYLCGANERERDSDFHQTVSDLKAFIDDAKKFVDDTAEVVGSRIILSKNRDHEYQNDEEIDSPLLSSFYTYGLTVEQVLAKLKEMAEGKKEERKQDGKFHYIPLERILYRDTIEMPIRSRRMMRETLVEVVFKKEGKWVDSDEIEERRIKKMGYDTDFDDPYKWERKACNSLNADARKRFDLDYDLFEKTESKIRLNPIAR